MPVPHLRARAAALAACLAAAPAAAAGQPAAVRWETIGSWRFSPPGEPLCTAHLEGAGDASLAFHAMAGADGKMVFLVLLPKSAATLPARARLVIALDGKRLAGLAPAGESNGGLVPVRVDAAFLTAFAGARTLEAVGEDGRAVYRIDLPRNDAALERLRRCTGPGPGFALTPPNAAGPRRAEAQASPAHALGRVDTYRSHRMVAASVTTAR